ncbi:PREDICTED: protein dif-1-like [Nicrophorus vespilloides]|uniref:Protein dif-1-like n=1 Tax=Nicrophorus vespilloides TaxID=110193 RepID=A0ABM1MU11_NICVS|nr:PREDICTED: protein dif-1-like [Nicrophorus vespilloides]
MGDVGPIEYFFYGGVGGMCTVLVGHPFDTVKVRLQTQATPKPGEKLKYQGMIDCFQKTIRKEGPLAIYKGMVAPIVTITPIYAVSFMGYRIGRELIGPKDLKDFRNIHYLGSGLFSGFFTSTVIAPGERIKCLLQIQEEGPKKYSGPVDVVVKLYKAGGLPNIFKGYTMTLCRDMPASGMYFLTYEALKNYLSENGTVDMTVLKTILAGGIAGMANWFIGMPGDVIKSRIQTSSEDTSPKARTILKELLATEGPTALFKGLIPVMVRAFPANAAAFLGFEYSKRFVRYYILGIPPEQTK